MSSRNNPVVFMDLSIYARAPKRILIELFADIVPKTAENFRALCTGEKGIGKTTHKPLHYKGSTLHYFYPHLAAEGGDFSNHNGTGGESIYGGTFEAEENPLGRSGPGILMTQNVEGPHSVGSLFLICFKRSRELEGNNVAFGKVIKGMEIVSALREVSVHAMVEIADCGELSDEELASQMPCRSESNAEKLVLGWDLLGMHLNNKKAKSEKPFSNPEETSESNAAGILELKTNNLLVTYDEPHQHSDDTSESSKSPISEDKNNVTETDKELETEVTESQELNAEISKLKRIIEELKCQVHGFERMMEVQKSERLKVEDDLKTKILEKDDQIQNLNRTIFQSDIVKKCADLEKLLKEIQKHDLESKLDEMRKDLESKIKSYLEEKMVDGDKKRSNSKVDWLVTAASVGAVILVGCAYFKAYKKKVFTRK